MLYTEWGAMLYTGRMSKVIPFRVSDEEYERIKTAAGDRSPGDYAKEATLARATGSVSHRFIPTRTGDPETDEKIATSGRAGAEAGRNARKVIAQSATKVLKEFPVSGKSEARKALDLIPIGRPKSPPRGQPFKPRGSKCPG